MNNVIGFSHVGIVVDDLQQAIDFYCAAVEGVYLRQYDWDMTQANPDEDLGLQVMNVPNSKATCALVRVQNCFIELFKYDAPISTQMPSQLHASDRGIAHMSFQVVDMDIAYTAWLDAGGKAHGHPVDVGAGRSLYCRDPFGNIVELMQIGEDEPDFDLLNM